MLQMKVDEAGTRDFDTLNDSGIPGQLIDQQPGNIPRGFFFRWSQKHGSIGGKISMLFIPGRLYGKRRHCRTLQQSLMPASQYGLLYNFL
jgi:hypothetical protein